MTGCRSCGAKDVVEVLRRMAVPVHQNLPLETATEARAVPRGDIVLRYCRTCGLVSNATFDPALLEYGSRYESTQQCSAVAEAHVGDVIASLLDAGLCGKRILEVGCGTGSFLRRLCAAGDNRGIGYDVSYNGPACDADGRVEFVPALFGPSADPGRVDAVVGRHVIEHVASPSALAAAAREAVGTDADFFFETPSLEWILDRAVFWDIFYEHCSYFTERALRNACLIAGLVPLECRRLFGRQYFLVHARAGRSAGLLGATPDEEASVVALARTHELRRARWNRTVRQWSRRGAVCVWGAGAKGVTFVNMVDPHARHVAFLVDINPRKQGKFVPGSGHQVRPPQAMLEGVTDVVVMNPNYLEECRTMLDALRAPVRLHVGE